LISLSGSRLEAGGIKIVVRRPANAGVRQIPFILFFADPFISVSSKPQERHRYHRQVKMPTCISVFTARLLVAFAAIIPGARQIDLLHR
jgi:tRNA G10  N-methylase Trm11